MSLGRCFLLIVTITLALSAGSGCATTTKRLGDLVSLGWITDYDKAEFQARSEGKGLLVFYRDPGRPADDALYELLTDPAIEMRTSELLRVMLFRSHEPDRRYLAQFGVGRAPALVIVHPDGTFHARRAVADKAEMFRFLADARHPGHRPKVDPFLPRRPMYAWHDALEPATLAAQQTGRPMLVVYERSWTRDGKRMDEVLQRPEVYQRFRPLVHCRIRLPRFSAEACITPFGVLKLPAMVLVHPDVPAHRTLEMPTSFEAVVRFADRYIDPRRAADVTSTTAAVNP